MRLDAESLTAVKCEGGTASVDFVDVDVAQYAQELTDILDQDVETNHSVRGLKDAPTETRVKYWESRKKSDDLLGEWLDRFGGAIGPLFPTGDGPLVLLLDTILAGFPIESVPSLRGRSVVRAMPTTLLRAGDCKRDSGYFVVNPERNLQKSEETLRPVLEELSKKNWHGATQEGPDPATLLRELTDRDNFLYCGHYGGHKYVSAGNLQKGCNGKPLRVRAMLMGCSSAATLKTCSEPRTSVRMRREWVDALRAGSDIELDGLPTHYLIGGAPAVQGFLWDVGATDIDKFSLGLVEESACSEGSIADGIARGRAMCQFKHLTPAAAVWYGYPEA
jgi:hypothetical protein